MKWVTRERARVDRIACPWLISRFIDKEPSSRRFDATRDTVYAFLPDTHRAAIYRAR